jgi:tRNA G18 (ribose-2'-O)-methylase SpoU
MRKLTHAEISRNRPKLEEIYKVKKLPVYVVLDNIRSSYNVGSIFRTSDGVMVEKLILCGYTPHPPNKDVLKTALGSDKSVQWEYIKDAVEAVKGLKKQGLRICALEHTDKSINYSKFVKDHFPICLILGNEISGVSTELIELCDYSLEIPQFGVKQSLNVAVAYGVSIFELRRIFSG